MPTQRFNSFKPSSSIIPHHKYDVFLSFRGDDVRDNFLEYLYRALLRKGILTFKDNVKLQGGKRIDGELYKAIEESRFSIVVLSKNYADSRWCLRELVYILRCKRNYGHVYPIFYHVKPQEVREQRGAFGEGFVKASFEKEELKTWRKALEEVGSLKGWVYPKTQFETEANLIDDLVHNVFHKLIDTKHIFLDDLVGITSRVTQVIKLLDLGSEETQAIGLWGMGGIGKTTLAKAVYDCIKWQFQSCSFIDVTEVLNKGGVLAFQEHLISNVLGEEDFKVRNVMHELSIIQNNISRIKVLMVLDNVSTLEQVEVLAGKLQYFGHGSRIIITTRDKHLLTVCGVRDVFKVLELNKDEAIQLFESKAFLENGKTNEFQSLVDHAVGYANGVPLALKVFGSFLLGGTVLEWESALHRFRESPGDEVERVLRISYDGLHWTEKEIFLDIACFFRGEHKDRVINILDSCDFNAICGINVLVKKSLLTISSYNQVLMHDLVQKMGWSIVDGDPIKEPGLRTRLWRSHEVKNVLIENTGTEKVQGIFLSSSENIQLQLRADAFSKMTNLRLLSIVGASCSVDLPYKVLFLQWIFGDRYSIDLPNKLCCLVWDKYPFKCMLSTFQPESLVELRLTNSCIKQLWDGTMVIPKLRFLDLSNSRSLTKSPEFTGFPNLEDVVFEECTALMDLHPSIAKLKKLRNLNLRHCSSLQTLPYGIESQCIEVLNFYFCRKLNKILENFGDLKQLLRLHLGWTGITELPHSIGNSTNLQSLSCSFCEKLESIPSSIGQLKRLEQLDLRRCSRLCELPEEVGLIDGLVRLRVAYSGVRQFPASIVQLKNLVSLEFEGCIETQASTSQISNSMPLKLPSFSGFEHLEYLFVRNNSLTSIHESVCLCSSVKSLELYDSDIESLPASIKYLSKLHSLCVRDCKSLQELPELPPNINKVRVERCDSLKTICSLTIYREATKTESLPTSIKYLSKLHSLWVRDCKSLHELPELPPNIKEVRVERCDSLKTICSLTVYREAREIGFTGCPKLVGNEEINSLLGYEFHSNHIKENITYTDPGSQTYTGPSSQIPEWFRCKNVGASVTFHVSKIDSNASNLLGFAFSFLVLPNHEFFWIDVRIKIRGKISLPDINPMDMINANRSNLCRRSYHYPSGYGEVKIWYFPLNSFVANQLIQMSGTDVEVCFERRKSMFDMAFEPVPEVKECGAHVFYKQDLRRTKRRRLTK